MEYKTKKQLDEEDWERYMKKQDDIYARKRAKFEAEGWKCVLELCNLRFKEYKDCPLPI